MSERLGATVGRALAWGGLSTILLRLSNMLLGIVLARLLSPREFGVYAVALAVQGILITITDLGLSADLVRAKDPKRREPTVATLSLITSVSLALLMVAAAVPVATALGSADAAPVIAVLGGTVAVAGLGVVPFARLQRGFRQKAIFATSLVDFSVGTAVTLVLVLLGWGPMALAVGRVVAQPCATALQFVLAQCRPRFGIDRTVVRSALAYGLPLAGANLVSIALLSVDKVVVARTAGEIPLGYYVLAFNVASWPMTAIGQTVRPVALAAFSHLDRAGSTSGHGLPGALRPTLAIAAPAAAVLAVASVPLVEVLYGERWLAAAPVLAALAAFGALRVAFDLFATFLMARGATRPVLWIQIAWLVALVPAMIFGMRWGGLPGAAWAHVAVGLAVVLPAYLWAGSRAGAPWRPVVASTLPGIAIAAVVLLAAGLAVRLIDVPAIALIAAGLVGGLVTVALVGRPVLRFLRSARNTDGTAAVERSALL